MRSPLSELLLRVLGVDFGAKRVGLSLSDPTGTVATPLETLQRRAGKRAPVERMAEIGREHGVEHVVMGLPLGLDGQENEWCDEVRSVGARLADRLGVEISFVDERMTSVRAERALREVGLSRSDRREKTRVDAAAAQLILQAWLDHPEIAR